MTFSLVLVDDWELRGDGSGDMRRIQFDTMRQLNKIYEDHGLRGSYNAEIMQQLHHLRFGDRCAELKELAHEWEEIVLNTYERGHDVQLHLHSQWNGATYEDGRWKLPGNWSILTYPRSEMERMISECKTYLEALLRRADPDYRCQSFRSGAWAIAPSDHILSVLAQNGIVFDMSICSGIKYDKPLKLDYTACEEGFQPYYPDMSDSRRVSAAPTPIISVPTLSFTPSRLALVRKDADSVRRKVASKLASRTAPRGAGGQVGSDPYLVWHVPLGQRLASRLWPGLTIADLSALTFPMMQEMVGEMRRAAAARGGGDFPVILENHTKDITDFSAIARFADLISRQADIDVITLKELAGRLIQGEYQIRRTEAAA
jgi:hypothetical protein